MQVELLDSSDTSMVDQESGVSALTDQVIDEIEENEEFKKIT